MKDIATIDEAAGTVNQSNDLLKAQYSLPLPMLRVLLLSLSKVNSKSLPKDNEKLTITTREFADSYGYNIRDCANIMRDAIDRINGSPIVTYDKETNEKVTFHWFNVTRTPLNPDSGLFHVKFSQEVMPYLFELKSNYSISEFNDIRGLTNVFQFRLYQWLKDGLYLGLTGKRNTAENTHSIIIGVDWMKEKTNITGYPVWHDFNKNILDKAVVQINNCTKYSVSYKPIRTGRKVTQVEFIVMLDRNTDLIAKPVRERLKRRPKVTAGSAAHGDWARVNIKKIVEFERRLKEYDPSDKITIADLKRLIEYYKIIGDTINGEKREMELNIRKS